MLSLKQIKQICLEGESRTLVQILCWIKIKKFHLHVTTHLMCQWNFLLLISLHRLFFKLVRIFAVDINCYLHLISSNGFTSYSWYYDVRGMNRKLLQKIYFLKNAKETCKPNNHDLKHDWLKKRLKFDWSTNYSFDGWIKVAPAWCERVDISDVNWLSILSTNEKGINNKL